MSLSTYKKNIKSVEIRIRLLNQTATLNFWNKNTHEFQRNSL